MSDNLPKEYRPSSLRPKQPETRTEVVYAIGYEDRKSSVLNTTSYGMTHGPTPNLNNMLEVVPDEDTRTAYIIRFNLDGTDEPIYQWHKQKMKWVRFTGR